MAVGAGVAVGAIVGSGVGVAVAVGSGNGVAAGSGAGTAVAVGSGVAVGVAVGSGVAADSRVAAGCGVSVDVGSGASVGVGVGSGAWVGGTGVSVGSGAVVGSGASVGAGASVGIEKGGTASVAVGATCVSPVAGVPAVSCPHAIREITKRPRIAKAPSPVREDMLIFATWLNARVRRRICLLSSELIPFYYG